MDIKKYENFIYNNARDLEVSLFNYHFLNDDIENCLLALSLYVNEDGGISNIDPNNLNNTSTLSASIYFLNIIFSLKYDNSVMFFNDIINDLIKYLIKQKEFSYYHKTNDKKPCSNIYKEKKYYYELEAITYAYISYYSTNKSTKLVYKEKLDKLILDYLNKNNPTYKEIYYFKIIEELFNKQNLKEKIIKDTTNLNNNYNYLIFSNKDYLFNTLSNNILNYKETLLNNKNHLGVWEEFEDWGNDYPEAEAASIKYLSITTIKNLLFLKNVGDIK